LLTLKEEVIEEIRIELDKKADAKKAGNLLSGTRLTGYVDPFSRAEEAESVQIKGLAKL
jgi:hypothetical protein